MRLEQNFFPKNHRGRRLLGSIAVRLTLLLAVDPVETDTLGVCVVQDFDGVAVEDRDDGAGEVSNGPGWAEQEQERAESRDTDSCPATRVEARPKDARPMKLSRQCTDAASLHRFCG